MERLTDVNMGIYTSFRTGGNADCMLIPDTPEELAETLREIRKSGSPFVMLGNGSNTLFTQQLPKAASYLFFTSPDLTNGTGYTLNTGSSTTSLTATTSASSGGPGGQGGGSFGPGGPGR